MDNNLKKKKNIFYIGFYATFTEKQCFSFFKLSKLSLSVPDLDATNGWKLVTSIHREISDVSTEI